MPAAPAPPPTGRWRFSLGSILLTMTVVSILCAVVRAVPMSDEMRQAMWALALLWAVLTLLAIAPGWLRYSSLQRQIRARHEALTAWAEQHREKKRGTAGDNGRETADV